MSSEEFYEGREQTKVKHFILRNTWSGSPLLLGVLRNRSPMLIAFPGPGTCGLRIFVTAPSPLPSTSSNEPKLS